MKQKNVFLMCGVPGSGKTTWVKNQLAMSNVGGVHISRDEVRFSMIGEDEDYFAREDEVFSAFCSKIQEALEDVDGPANIYIDATHLNKRSRDKVLRRVHKDNIEELNCVCFDVPLAVCISRNNLRAGRSRVPETAIYNMYQSYRLPDKEIENFDHIIIIDENGDTNCNQSR